MQKLQFAAIILCLLVIACKKTETPPTSFSDPVFTASFYGSDSTPVTLTAGSASTMLFTSYDLIPIPGRPSDDLFHSVSTFANADCPNGDCPGSVSFEFQAKADPETFLMNESYAFTLPDSLASKTGYFVKLGWAGIPMFPQNTFVISADQPETYANSISAWTRTFTKDKLIPYTLTTTSIVGYRSYISRSILLSDPDAYPQVGISALVDGNNGFTLEVGPQSNNLQYLWSNGSTSGSIHVDAASVSQDYFVTVTDEHGYTAVAGLGGMPAAPQYGIRNSNVVTEVTATSNPLQLSTIVIQWVGEDGKIWRSDRNKQPESTYFYVESSEPYESNDGNVRKLKVVYSCILFDVEGNEWQFAGEATLAIARP